MDYLADLNGDGAYELMDSDSSPMRDTLNQKSILSAVTDGPCLPLTSGETYIVSAESLSSRYQQSLLRGAQALGLEEAAPQSFPLCRVTLRRAPAEPEQDYQRQTYYLELYGKVLVPFDLSPGQWYYNAVEYGLAQGYFSGMEDGRFRPDDPLSRGQLAQVLWTVGGCLESDGSRFSDAAPGDWYYPAVSWCQQEGLIAGYLPLGQRQHALGRVQPPAHRRGQRPAPGGHRLPRGAGRGAVRLRHQPGKPQLPLVSPPSPGSAAAGRFFRFRGWNICPD